MSLSLSFSLRNPELSTYEGLKADFELASDEPTALEIPGPDDDTDALTLDVFSTEGRLVRRMNGLSRQRMTSDARIDDRPDLDRLPPRGRWTWSVDYAGYHYPLPAGEYEVEARYRFGPRQIDLHAPRQRVRVAHSELGALHPLRDRTVLDRLALLARTSSAAGERFFLRQLGSGRPLAASYAEPLALADCRGEAFLAAPNFIASETFDESFRSFVVWEDGRRVYARELVHGIFHGEERVAELPPGRMLLPSAFYTRAGELSLFLRDADGTLECHELLAGALSRRFAYGPLPRSALAPCIRADRRYLHVVVPERGLVYARLGMDGRERERVRLFDSRLRALSCDIDPGSRQVRAIFGDTPHGRSLTLVSAGPRREDVRVRSFESLRVRGEVVEAAYDLDADGGVHLLFSTSTGKLHYLGDGQGELLVATGQSRYFPCVRVSLRVYLGCQLRDLGYRFLELARRAGRPRIVDHDRPT